MPRFTLPLPSPPDWIYDIRRKYVLRVTDWVTQAWSMTVAPRRFLDDWSAGRREMLNPLRFVAVGTTATLLCERGARWLLHQPANESPLSQFFRTTVGSLAAMTMIGLVVHLCLRPWSKVPVRTTLAAIAFSVAGPGVVAVAAAWALALASHHLHRDFSSGTMGGVGQAWEDANRVARAMRGQPRLSSGAIAFPLPVVVASYASVVWTVIALATAHGVRWWKALAAFVLGVVVVTLLAGSLGIAFAILAPRASASLFASLTH